MTRVLVLVACLAGCHIDVVPDIDLNGSDEPLPVVHGPSLADAQIARGVAVDGLWIGYIDGTRVEIHGSLEPSADQERWKVAAFPLAAVTPVPFEMPFLRDPAPFALWADAAVELVMRLTGPQGERLVDQSLTVELAGAQRKQWDLYRLAASGDVLLDVIAAERAWTLGVRVVGAIDDLVTIPIYAHLDALPPAGEVTVCFAALAGDLRVAGLSWEIAGAGVQLPSASSATGGCAVITQPRDGMEITVRAGGRERTFMAHLARRP